MDETKSLSNRKEKSSKHSSKSKSKRERHSSDEEKSSSSKKHHRHEESSSKSKHNRDKEPESAAPISGDSSSLSIEETNKLRAKLGLKPLSLSDNKETSSSEKNNKSTDSKGKKTYLDKDTNQEFEHVPATNIAEIKEQKELRQKLQEQREKRQLAEKYRKAKGIADSDSDEGEHKDEDAQKWLEKLKEKENAAKKAKLLQEMDEQFGLDELIGESKKRIKTPAADYTSSNLKGLKVEHDQAMFKEGQEIILTLKDRAILKGKGDNLDVDDDEEADVLVNVNIVDDEKALKNVENKKKKPDYRAYDEFDEEGLYKEKTILDKYNEELNGEQKKSFKLDAKGAYDTSDLKFLEKLDQDHKARAIRINALNELKFATDYMTQEEMEKFKKPKKIRKVLRKNKMIKADDLLPLPMDNQSNTEFKSKNKRTIKSEELIKKEPGELDEEKKQPGEKKISLKDIDFGLTSDNESSESDNSENDENESDNEQKLDEKDLNELKQIVDEENNALEELHSVLSKTRQRVTSSILNSNNLIKQETINHEDNHNANGISYETLNTIKEAEEDADALNSNSLTLDTMSEFCRNLGSLPTTKTDSSEKIKKQREEEDEEDMDLEAYKNARSSSESEDGDSDVDMETGKRRKKQRKDGDKDDENLEKNNEEEFELLEEEAVIDRGLASALKIAVNKGYIEQQKSKQNARFKKESIEAKNYCVEEKNYYDIDDKYNRNRDRFSGPLSDFQEKNNYKPDIKLDYIDEKGHAMNEKEAFRYLSHRFHGKGSGKKKTEKQNKKIKEMEVMNKMSSIDTPLNTVALLVEKQKKLQQPFVVLSASKGKQDQVTLHKR